MQTRCRLSIQRIEEAARIIDPAFLGEEKIVEGMRLLHRHAGVVAEPSGAVGLAALLQHGEMFRGRLVGTIVCGGNLTPDQMRHWL